MTIKFINVNNIDINYLQVKRKIMNFFLFKYLKKYLLGIYNYIYYVNIIKMIN